MTIRYKAKMFYLALSASRSIKHGKFVMHKSKFISLPKLEVDSFHPDLESLKPSHFGPSFIGYRVYQLDGKSSTPVGSGFFPRRVVNRVQVRELGNEALYDRMSKEELVNAGVFNHETHGQYLFPFEHGDRIVETLGETEIS